MAMTGAVGLDLPVAVVTRQVTARTSRADVLRLLGGQGTPPP